MKQKQLVTLILAIVLSITMAASASAVTISVGFENNMDDAMSKAVEKWAEIVEAKSNGEVVFKLFPNSQLGSKSDLIDSMQLGEQVITVADGAFLAEYGAPDLGILYGPYLFTNWEQVWTLVESEWFNEQNALLNSNGLTIISANWKLGERNIFLVNPIKNAKDLAGRKIRVPSNQVQIQETNAIGAAATPMAASEVYQALQTGTIDGLENVNSALLGVRWCEVAKYIYEDNHVYNMAIWVAGTSLMDSLTEQQRNWIIESANEAGLYNNDLQDEFASSVKDQLVNVEGVTYIPCSEEDKAYLVECCESFYANSGSFGWSTGLYERIQEIISK